MGEAHTPSHNGKNKLGLKVRYKLQRFMEVYLGIRINFTVMEGEGLLEMH